MPQLIPDGRPQRVPVASNLIYTIGLGIAGLAAPAVGIAVGHLADVRGARGAYVTKEFRALLRAVTNVGISVGAVGAGWIVVVPIPGSSRPETIRDSAAAPELTLSAEEFAELDAAR